MDVLESAHLGAQVVGSTAGLNVLVVRSTVQHNLAIGRGVAGVRVVRHLIRSEDIHTVVDLSLTVKLVGGSVSFLFAGPDDHVLASRE
jgi:hypothetical protein